MLKRFTYIFGIGVVLLAMAGCHNKHVQNPIAKVDSKQPDKVLFDRAMEAMKGNKFDVARLTLQTLINTYPDSEFVARAKLAIGDSWYAEGSSTALMQAENEYKDFITFFPNMPEAAEAQLKIANIHYREMEKPDRDFTHAKRAEDEYRQLITMFPDSKLVPQAKERLLEVQEVLAEREFRIGKFYYTRESWVASEARLQSLVDAYPLYSGADEALFLLGSAYQRQADLIRGAKVAEAAKGAMIKKMDDKSAAAFDKILTRYPVMPRAEDAKKMLEAMHRPVPKATPEAVAMNKREQESRSESGMWDRVMANLHKGPDVKPATKVGEPPLVDPRPASAPEMLRQSSIDMQQAMMSATAPAGTQPKLSVETIGNGAPPPNEAPPRSDAGQPDASQPAGQPDPNAIPELQPVPDATQSDTSQTTTPPTQLNEVERQNAAQQNATGDTSSSSSSSAGTASGTTTGTQAASGTTDPATSDQGSYSTSQKKKKKGLRKVVPF